MKKFQVVYSLKDKTDNSLYTDAYVIEAETEEKAKKEIKKILRNRFSGITIVAKVLYANEIKE